MLGQAYVRVRMDQSLISEGLSSIKSAVLGTMQEIGAVAGGILAAAGIQSMTSSLAGLASQFITTNDKLQQYQTSLSVLFGSEQKANEMIGSIQEMAAKTPFGTDDLTQAIVQLKIFGFEAEELLPTIRAIGDAAAASPAGMESGVQRISYALGEIRANGKIMASEMRQLASAGVPAWDIIAQKTGKTVANIREMSKNSELDAATYLPIIIEGMEKRFGGMMAKQSTTWSGLMSTLGDEASFAMRDIGRSFFDAAWGRLKSIVTWLDSSAADAFKQRMIEIVKQVTKLADSKVDQAMQWLTGDGAAGFAGDLKDAATWVYQISMASLENLWAFVNSNAVRMMAADLGQVAMQLTQIAGVKLQKFTEWLNTEQAAAWLKTFQDICGTVIQLASDFGALAIGAVVVSRLHGAITALTPSIAGLITTFQAGGLLALVNPMTALVAVVGLLAAAFIGARLEGVAFGDYVMMMLGRIAALGGEAQDAVSKLKREMEAEKEFNQNTGAADEAAKGEVTDEKVEALKGSLAALEAERDEKLTGVRGALIGAGALSAPMPGESQAQGAYRDAKKFTGGTPAMRNDLVADATDAMRAEQQAAQVREKLAARKAELAEKKSQEKEQARFDSGVSPIGSALGGGMGMDLTGKATGLMGAMVEAAAKESTKKASLTEKMMSGGSMKAKIATMKPMPGGLFGMGDDLLEKDKDKKGNTTYKLKSNKEVDADRKKRGLPELPKEKEPFQTSFHGFSDFNKQIQLGLGQQKKDKSEEIASTSLLIKQMVDRIDKRSASKETKPPKNPKAG